MVCLGNTLRGAVEAAEERRGVTRPITIGDSCIVEIDNRIFLIVQILIENVERVVIFRISRELAEELMRDGIRNCPVFNTLPEDVRGRAVELECVFVVGGQAFLVFETERASERLERLFVVRAPLCTIEREEI